VEEKLLKVRFTSFIHFLKKSFGKANGLLYNFDNAKPLLLGDGKDF
jgi:hypothetical protein